MARSLSADDEAMVQMAMMQAALRKRGISAVLALEREAPEARVFRCTPALGYGYGEVETVADVLAAAAGVPEVAISRGWGHLLVEVPVARRGDIE